MTDAYKIIDHIYDTVVVGAGGSGLRATMGSASHLRRRGPLRLRSLRRQAQTVETVRNISRNGGRRGRLPVVCMAWM